MKKALLSLFVVASLTVAHPTQATCLNTGFIKIGGVFAAIGISAISYAAWEAKKDERFFLNCLPELTPGDRQRFPWKFTQEGDIEPEFLNQPRCADALQVLGHFGGSTNRKIIVASVIGGPSLVVAVVSVFAFAVKTMVIDRFAGRAKPKKD